ncbi:hypothetical protein [Bdellovibrio sp. NC01]|uniref:hypothetical protein n=1 Tax=Bdellovibrio sp. NC01 TaxID=2220073 RepID=UPI001158037C|nr:hypothetical protein [Bdellovibrio sp. NC01]QDK37090.1 hypothetical protein DOE51_05530 [Bdellovibrio sp. NC01]
MEQESTQKRSLLIIKSHAQGLAPAESFLKNRDWVIKSTANLKEALIYLVQNQPQFVMVSIDHPNRKVRNLPKVLTQAFPVVVIAFSETASAANLKILSETSAEYAIFPPITGPSIERTVNKYYKDLQTKGLSASSRDSSWGQAEGGQAGMISIKGANGSNEASANFLAQFLAGDNDDQALMGSLSSKLDASQQGSQGDAMHARSSSSQADANPSNANGISALEKNNPFANAMQADEPKQADYHPSQKKNNGPGWAPTEMPAPSKERPGAESLDYDRKRLAGQDSLMSQGARDALEKSCINFTEPVVELEKATNMACILVESSRFSGYLIAAMAKDKKMDTLFIDKVRSRLFKFLRDNGEQLPDSETMPIKVKEVPFEDWALEHADFLRKSAHNGEEIAMAFFPRRDLKVKLLDCSDEEMAAIHIDELSSDIPVEFNVYIYLPRNNKYLLYTPCGGTFMHNQKERLVNSGVSHLHILRLELAGLDKYRAQNFLNDKINEFQAKERDKVLV